MLRTISNNFITHNRYGYNGMELDNEISGNGNSYTTEFRQYDPRLGRWKSLDPLMAQFPWQSPYCSMDNNPISLVDPTGQAAEDGENEDWYKNQNGEVQYFEDMTQESFTEDLAIYNPLNNKLENAGSNQWTKTDHVPNKDEVPVSSQTSLIPEINSEFSLGVSIETTIVGGAADLTLKELKKEALERTILNTISKSSGVVGGVFSTFDNGIQSYNDFNKSNYGRGSINTAQTVLYSAGTVLMFIPGGQVAGGLILLSATISDWIQTGVETQTGTDY